MGTITRSFANNITSGGTFDATDLTGTIPASNIADASVTNITAVPALVATTTVASDPPSPDAGQVWYNTTDKALRAYIAGPGSWATGGSLNTARNQLAGAGTTTAALAFGGTPPDTGATEEYNGTSWTEVNDLNLARQGLAGAGVQNSALAFGGYSAPTVRSETETWNGTSWTEVNNLNTARNDLGGNGTQTSAIGTGGSDNVGTTQPASETWNGTSWTEVSDINTSARGLRVAAADSSNAIKFGGGPPGIANTELWNGSAWTEVNDLNTARFNMGAAGTYTSALAFGGETTPGARQAVNEQWNGVSWTEVADLATARSGIGGAGTQASALGFGGASPTITGATEEWSLPEVVTDLGVS
jgi:hypothetical protein